ncbi:tyrosine-type recombinase/integrase [Streptomyces sp. NBC_00525]|uniref:tyrosine-type recombinase/integrase n=1 Tax=Streptomyces sp. NBC_00525 TaxID=2903660 RepID=UPI002E7FE54C|nr:tyrosine-type recombinase/integrase [Streptomyces sp. NBC_00525]WUC94602.1 tyrosine-type recombinase/integrase [Streptomyces sp. NBC_00525]
MGAPRRSPRSGRHSCRTSAAGVLRPRPGGASGAARAGTEIAGEHWSQKPEHDLIFSSEHGGMIDPVGFSRSFDRLVKRAGVRRITVRLARHTCGTLLAFLKVHPKVAQAILRHSQISMTMDVYTHVVGDGEREAVTMLAELLEDPLIG